MLPAPSSLITYPDAYVAIRPTVMSAAAVGKLLGQKTAAGELNVFLACWWEVVGRRISAGVAQLLPAIWSDNFRNSPAAWFDGGVCRSCPLVEQILREAESSGLGLTPDALRNMCWGPIQLHTKDGECAWTEAAFDPDELASAFPEIWAPTSAPAAFDPHELASAFPEIWAPASAPVAATLKQQQLAEHMRMVALAATNPTMPQREIFNQARNRKPALALITPWKGSGGRGQRNRVKKAKDKVARSNAPK
jgi:hypothetical protein